MPARPPIPLTLLPAIRRRCPAKLAPKVRRAVRLVLQGEGVSEAATVSVVFCDDATIRALNRRFLGRDAPTDVLSFALDAVEPTGPRWLGEVVVSVDTAARNARRYRQPLERELLRCVIHGTLHLLGYDDATPTDRRRMRAKERAYLRAVECEDASTPTERR